MKVSKLLKLLNPELYVQLLPGDENTVIYKKHNNQFTDTVFNFLDGNGILDKDTDFIVTGAYLKNAGDIGEVLVIYCIKEEE